MTSNLMATKLYQPTPPPKRVERPRLVRRLNEGLAAGRQLTLVSAPAGFGKTTCIGEWVNTLDLPVAWLSLDPADDDPARFFAYLVSALQRVDKNLGREIDGAFSSTAGQLPPIESLLASLLNDILQAARFLLVLDDWHVIRDSTLLKTLEELVTNQPANLHLVLVTREDPQLPLARLRANNQMTEIRAGDLRFTRDEANRFLNELMELCLSGADVATLADRTEGWVVGLQLAGLSLRGRADSSDFIAHLSGSHRYILSYLTEQVLGQQTDETTRFLLQTSILDRLSGELCDAVTGRADSAAWLERLFTANLFLVPLDDEQHWYRYHQLFADLLAHRLRQTVPLEEIQELHRRASEWLAQNDWLDEAIQHALQGKDYPRAATLVEQVARRMMFTGRANTLRNWLQALPPASFQTYPRLSIYRVWIDLMQGKSDLSEQALQEKETMLQSLPPSPENDRLRMELAVVLCRFMALVGSTRRAIRLAEQALASLTEGDLAWRARAHSALASAYMLEGDIDRAKRAFDECLRLTQSSGNYSLAAHTIFVMGMGHITYGQLRQAARLYQSIVDLGVRAGQREFYPAGQGDIGLASIYLEWNDLETAEDYLKRGIELCRQGGLSGVSAGHTIKARLFQARGDFKGALEENSTAQTVQSGIDPSVVARQILIRLAMGDLDEATRLAMPWMNLFGGESVTPRIPLLVLEDIQTVLIRVLLAQAEIERATQLIDQLQATAEPGKRFGQLIQVHLLRALALQKQNQGKATAATIESFERALDLAEPEGYVLLFLEEGAALIPLLNAVCKKSAAPERITQYARKLLSAFPGDTRPAAGGEMIEPLSKRELQVLRLMAEGLTYDQVAQRLVVTVNTVRFHVKSIYGKLGVEKRAAAIDRARALRLL